MTAIRNQRHARRILRLTVIFGAFLLFSGAPRLEARNLAGKASTKLTTVLADLVRSISPAEGQAPAERAAPGTGFSMASMPKSVRDAAQHRMMRINAKNEVQVYILVDAVTDENLSQLRAGGVTVEIPDAAHRRVQARIPVAQLQSVADLPFVNFIRLPNYAIRLTGSVNTEGDAILRADLARAQTGVNGTGVSVGVISDGIKGVFATGCTTCGGVAGGPISTGDLPSANGTRNASGVLTSSTGGIIGTSFVSGAFGTANDLEGLDPGCAFAGAGAEGTALLEIVHDIAPGAQLSFANADTDLAFQNAVDFLAASNDIVTDDLGFVGLPYDGTSGVSANTASALNNNSNRIRGYFTSVGNFADEHYYGAYASSGVAGNTISGITNSGHLHLFQSSADTADALALGPKPYNVIKLPDNGSVYVFLTWDDSFGSSNNDYDLFLVRESTGAIVARSENPQTGTQEPFEAIAFTNSSSATDNFHVVVQNFGDSAQTKNLSIFSFQPQCAEAGPLRLAPPRHERLNFNTATKSVPAQSDSGGSPVSVTSVGAICSASQAAQDVFGGDPTRDESCFDTSNSTLEFFSSLGPTHDGRNKPDISAIDGVAVTAAGSFENPFFGTSAAAPHMAGIAALVLQSAPCLLDGSSGALEDAPARTNLRDMLLENAVPLGGAIPNNTFGAGRADALASVQAALPNFAGATTVTFSGNTPTGINLSPTQVGFNDPNSCPLTTLNWTGGCGTGPAASMNCPFGTNNINVSASNNGLSFSSASDVQIVVTNFVVGVLPATQTITAGQSADYAVTVSAVGGAYTNDITLACTGLPAETSCSFNPATVNPGTFPTSTLTITTLPRPASAPGSFAPTDNLPVTSPAPGTAPRLLWLAFAALVLLSFLAVKRVGRRRLAAPIAAYIVLAIFALQLACGGGGNPPPPPAPAVSLTPSSLTFASQGFMIPSVPQAITLRNTGHAALSLTSIASSGDFSQSNNCGASLTAGASCAINVTFTPTAAGSRTGAVTITDNAANSPHSASLTGTGSPGTTTGSYPIGITGKAGTLLNTSAGVTLTVQ